MFSLEPSRRHFDTEMKRLTDSLLAMGRLTEERLKLAVRALIERDPDLAALVIGGDDDINQFHVDIDEHCFTLLALHQPAAIDLRTIMAAVKIISDLERVGDLAENIAEATLRHLAHPPVMTFDEIVRMSDWAQTMLRDAIDAFASQDVLLAQQVLDRDDTLDRMKNDAFRDLVSTMLRDRSTIEPALNLVLISRHLERVGDHATNIAEDVIFVVPARDVRHPLPAVTESTAAEVKQPRWR